MMLKANSCCGIVSVSVFWSTETPQAWSRNAGIREVLSTEPLDGPLDGPLRPRDTKARIARAARVDRVAAIPRDACAAEAMGEGVVRVRENRVHRERVTL